jgi:hypothetical protein
MATNCHSLKATLLEFLNKEIEVVERQGSCVLTFPQKTIDSRFPAVFIEKKMDDYFVVHDGGKTSAELFAQGIHLTDVKLGILEQLADCYGATFVKGMFTIGCRRSELNASIMAMGQCATLGTWHVLGHKPAFTEEPVLHRVESGLRLWNAPYERDVLLHVKMKGRKATHFADFVSYPRNTVREPIAIRVLRPSDNPLDQARGYGFMVLDTENTIYQNWLRMAVVTKKDEWTRQALELVRDLATKTVEVESGDEGKLEELIPERLSEIAA